MLTLSYLLTMAVFRVSAACLNKLRCPRGLRNGLYCGTNRADLQRKVIWCVSKWDDGFLTMCGLYFWARVVAWMNSIPKRWSKGHPYAQQPHTVKQPNLETQRDD